MTNIYYTHKVGEVIPFVGPTSAGGRDKIYYSLIRGRKSVQNVFPHYVHMQKLTQWHSLISTVQKDPSEVRPTPSAAI